MDVAVFDLERRDLPGLQTMEIGEVSLPVLRMDERSEVDLAELLLTVTEQGAICGVRFFAAIAGPRCSDSWRRLGAPERLNPRRGNALERNSPTIGSADEHQTNVG
jgi:hypothetical protein